MDHSLGWLVLKAWRDMTQPAWFSAFWLVR